MQTSSFIGDHREKDNTSTASSAATLPVIDTDTHSRRSILNQVTGIDGRKNEEEEKNIYDNVIYTNQFVLKIPGGESAAKEFASKHGFIYLDQVMLSRTF